MIRVRFNPLCINFEGGQRPILTFEIKGPALFGFPIEANNMEKERRHDLWKMFNCSFFLILLVDAEHRQM